MNNYLQILTDVRDQLTSSATNMVDGYTYIMNAMTGEQELQDNNYTIIDRLGRSFEWRFSNSKVSIYQIVSNGKQLIQEDVDAINLNPNQIYAVSDDVMTTIQSQLTSLKDSVNLNEFIVNVTENVINTGEIAKSDMINLLSYSDINSMDKAGLVSLLSTLPANILPGHFVSFLSNLYSTVQGASVSNDGNSIELNTTRGLVPGFISTLLMNVNLSTVSAVLLAITALIPSVIGKVVTLIASGLTFVMSKVSSELVHYTVDDQAIYPYVSAPLSILSDRFAFGRRADNDVLMQVKGVSAVRITNSLMPIDGVSFKTSNDSSNSLSNGYLSLKLNARGLRACLYDSIIYEDAGYRLDGAVLNTYLEQYYMLYMINKNNVGDEYLINYTAGDLSSYSDEYIANLVLGHITLFLLSNHEIFGPISPDLEWWVPEKVVGASGEYTYESDDFHVMEGLLQLLYNGMKLIKDDNYESSIGLNSVKLINDFINYCQDSKHDETRSLSAVINLISMRFTMPSIKTLFDHSLEVYSLRFMNRWNTLYPSQQVSRNEARRLVLNCTDASSTPSKFTYTLPAYSRLNVIRALTVASIAITGVIIGFIGVKRIISKRLFAKRMQLTSALRNARETYNSNPTKENLDAFWRVQGKYKLAAAFYGFPEYDAVNDWFNDDSGKASTDVSVMNKLDNISMLITGPNHPSKQV